MQSKAGYDYLACLLASSGVMGLMARATPLSCRGARARRGAEMLTMYSARPSGSAWLAFSHKNGDKDRGARSGWPKWGPAANLTESPSRHKPSVPDAADAADTAGGQGKDAVDRQSKPAASEKPLRKADTGR